MMTLMIMQIHVHMHYRFQGFIKGNVYGGEGGCSKQGCYGTFENSHGITTNWI
jgi:hypothetical protein